MQKLKDRKRKNIESREERERERERERNIEDNEKMTTNYPRELSYIDNLLSRTEHALSFASFSRMMRTLSSSVPTVRN